MKKSLKVTLIVLAVGLICTIAGGLFATWPFNNFPKTDIHIERVAAFPSKETDGLMAGVAVRDITAGINIPKMGYSAWARQADGFRIRLKARAFYIKPSKGEPIAVVQTDLPTGSLILHHKVAETVAKQTDIQFHNLSITSTHNHNGPGNYLTSDFYNAFGSNQPGFDPDVFNFLVEQISDALIQAYEEQKPAKIAVGHKTVYGFTKNRSLEAYVQNSAVEDKEMSEMAALRAVNPVMTMVRIDMQDQRGDFKPAGAFTSFSIHGTAMPPFEEPYHGDVWSYFERELEWKVAQHYQTPWPVAHGTFEATHGDNNPAYRHGARGDLETRRIGMGLGEAAWELFQSLDHKLKRNGVIESAMREINILEENAAPLCDRAIVGAATVGAAHGDAMFPISFVPPFRSSWPRSVFKDGCHGEKQWMLSKLQPFGIAPSVFPHLVLLHLIRIDDQLMVGVPFEVTYQSGVEISAAIQKVYDNSEKTINRIAIHSLANGFFGYSTTKDEYSRQYYEGGHTIYGPGTSEFLARESAKLAEDQLLVGNFAHLPESWDFSLATQRFSLQRDAIKTEREQLTEATYYRTRPNGEGYWSLEIADVPPNQIDLHNPLLSIETKQGEAPWTPLVINHIPVDDEGYEMQLLFLTDMNDGHGRYELRWFNPIIAEPEQAFRFKVEARGDAPVFYSKAFR